MRRFSGRVTPWIAPMMAVVFVRRRTLRSARPLAIASGSGSLCSRIRTRSASAEVALVLLDPGAGQRAAELGQERAAEELRHRQVRDVGEGGVELLGPLGAGGRADAQHVDQRAARVANRLEDLLRAAPAVVFDDDAGAGAEVGLDEGVDAPRVAGDDVDTPASWSRRASGRFSTMNSISKPGSRISSSILMTSSSWQTARHRIVDPNRDYTLPAEPRRSARRALSSTIGVHMPSRLRPLHASSPISSSPGDQARAIGELTEGLDRGDRAPGAARRHRVGQDVHHGADHRRASTGRRW